VLGYFVILPAWVVIQVRLGLSAVPERIPADFRGVEGCFLGAVVDLVATAGSGGGDEDFGT
jgi:hypothetical protein